MHERITTRMTSDMIARIDTWIASQPGYVSRQDAVGHCVNLVLGQDESDAPPTVRTAAVQASKSGSAS